MSGKEDIVIGKRFKEFRKDIAQSQEVLALELNVSQSYIAGIETGRNKIPIAIMRHMQNKYDLSNDWLMTGKGSMYVHDSGKKSKQNTPNDVHPTNKSVHLIAENNSDSFNTRQNVIMVPVAAQAGLLGQWTQEWVDQNLVRTSLPGIKEEAYAFEVEGDSMVPTIHPGDYVVGRKMEKGQDIRDSRVHIIISKSSGVYIKRAYIGQECIILESDNDNYPPVALPEDDVHAVYYAIQRITGNFSGPRPFSSRLERIEDYLAKRFTDFRAQED